MEYSLYIPLKNMKRITKAVSEFLKREWFLFVAITIIALIIVLFERV